MKTAEIRRAHEVDYSSITAIRNDVIIKTTAIYEDEVPTSDEMKKWYDWRIDNGFPLFVVELDDKVVGFCGYAPFRGATGYKSTVELFVHVAEIARGRGLGTMMLEYILHDAKQKGYHAIVGAIDATNKPSIDMHKKQGFELVGTMPQIARKFDRWLDLCLMQKLL